MHIKQRILNGLRYIPPVLKALWLFLPGITFLLLAVFTFWHLGQGKDVIRQCLERPPWVGAIAVAAIVFWVFVTWYSARLVAYNHDELYNQSLITAKGKAVPIGKILLYHGPRLVAFAIFAVLLIAFIQYDYADALPTGIAWSILLIEFALYLLWHRFFDRYQSRKRKEDNEAQLIKRRYQVRAGIVAACAAIIAFWGNKIVLVAMLAIIQFGFLFLVIVRRPVATWKLQHDPPVRYHALDGFLDWVFGKGRLTGNASMRELKEAERSVFLFFNLLAFVCFAFYAIAIFSLPFARYIGSLAFVFLAFGILLGAGNFIGLLSKRLGTNFFFIAIVVLFVVGLFSEPHWVRVIKDENNSPAFRRPDFKTYLQRWITDSSRYTRIKEAPAGFAVFFVLADGGASRSGYWTALVLSRLTDETKEASLPFYRHLFCLSGASGGSVGNGAYLAALAHKNALLREGMGFQKTTTAFLGSDFLTFTLARLLGPDLLAPVTHWFAVGDRAWALEKSIEQPQGGQVLAGAMQAPFPQFYPPATDTGFLYPIIVFNATRMQDGNPGVVSNFDPDTVAFGNRIDVLDSIQAPETLRLSTAMILGSRFPYISPAGRIGNSYFVDGGYFDNSGAGVVHEMLLEIARIKRNHLLPAALEPLLHKLRFYVIHITNSPYEGGRMEPVHPFRNDLAAPLLTLVGSYESQTNVNNTRLQNYLKEIAAEKSYLQFNLYKPGVKESFPMNWVISGQMQARMNERVFQIEELDSLIRRLNSGEINLFRQLNTQSAPKVDSGMLKK
jgi:hypothetical protein